MTITQEIEVDVDIDEVLEEAETSELINIVQERLEDAAERRDFIKELVSDISSNPDDMRMHIIDICSIHTKRVIDKKTAKDIINEIIDNVFFEV